MAQDGNIWTLTVEFSIPKPVKPITEGTVTCYFYITELGDGKDDYDLEF